MTARILPMTCLPAGFLRVQTLVLAALFSVHGVAAEASEKVSDAASDAVSEQVASPAAVSTPVADESAESPETSVPDGTSSAENAAEARRFDVWSIAVDGNTLLPATDIQELLAQHTGPAKSVRDIDFARDRLQALYNQRGFQTVSVQIAAESQKTIADGLLVLQVNEGRISRLSVSGARYFSSARIRAALPALQEGSVPDFSQIQKEILALGRFTDLEITPSITPDPGGDGFRIDLAVQDRLPMHGMVELNNRHSHGTEELRAMGMLSYDNLFQRGHGLTLMYQTAPERPDDGQVLFASWLMRFADPGYTLQFTALDTNSDVAALGGINILGNGSVLGIKFNRQWVAGNGGVSGFTASVERKDFLNQVQNGGVSIDSPLTYYPLTLGWQTTWRNEEVEWRTALDGMINLPGMGSDNREIDVTRYTATRQMRWLRGSVRRDEALSAHYRWRLSASFQLTDVPLVSNEHINAGGMDSVRGYYEAENTGDIGVVAGAELHLPSPGLLLEDTVFDGFLSKSQPFLFIDVANLSLVGALPAAQAEKFELYSVGAGIELGAGKHAQALLVIGVPLADAAYTQKHEPELKFRVWATF